MTFSATLPVKPSATITSASPVPIAKPSTLPTKFRPGAPASSAVRGDDVLRCPSSPRCRWTAAPRAGDATPADGLHERRPHVRELDQVLRADLDVGARVEQQERLAGDRDDDRQRGPVHAAGALEGEQRGGERRAGRAAADQRVGLARRDRGDRAHDRRLGRAPDRARRVGVLGDRDRRVDDRHALGRPAPIAAAGPNRTTRTPPAAARAAPRATSAGPWSAPLTSTATVTGSVIVIVIVVVHVHDLAPAVEPAVRAHAMRTPRPAALRAAVHRGSGDLVLRASLRGARVRLLLLGDGHRSVAPEAIAALDRAA